MGYEFFGEKIIFRSAPVPGINNDQSLRRKSSRVGHPCIPCGRKPVGLNWEILARGRLELNIFENCIE